jgi:sugar/nucleoside kinase (ribokinase family)
MKKRALFIGLTVVDVQFFVDEFPRSNQKTKTGPPLVNVGGPAANAAITFSYLGGESNLLTCIGKNSFTSFIHEEYAKYSVEFIDITENESIDPIISSVITSLKNGERSIISSYPGPITFPAEKIDLIDLSNYDLVFTDGFYPEISIPVCRKAVENNIPVVFDGGSWKPASDEILRYVDIAICSEQFFPPGCQHFLEVIQYLNRKGIGKIAITRGEKCIQWSEDNKIKNIEVPITDSIDSLGAGDIFHGAFSWFILGKNDLEMSLFRATQVASFSTRYKGTREWMKHFIDLINE